MIGWSPPIRGHCAVLDFRWERGRWGADKTESDRLFSVSSFSTHARNRSAFQHATAATFSLHCGVKWRAVLGSADDWLFHT